MATITGLKPLEFLHVLDLNTNVTRVVVGPRSFVLQTHEKLVGGPFPFVCIPPGGYCIVCDPCRKYDAVAGCKLRHGEQDIRLHGDPFPLYPGERLKDAEAFSQKSTNYTPAIKPLPVVKSNHALRLEARVQHQDGKKVRRAGDQWQLEGPLTYIPSPYVDILKYVEPRVIRSGEALRVRARWDTVDTQGRKRVTGEEWLIIEEGAYLPGVLEEVIAVEKAVTLTRETAVHLRAVHNLCDSLGKDRQAGEEWLVTEKDTEQLFPTIGVEIIRKINCTVVKKGEYCVVLDPMDSDGHPQPGRKEVRCGCCTFFLHPGESLEGGVLQAYILGPNEAVVLQAEKEFTDTALDKPVKRRAGDRWMVHGSAEYIPPVEVTVVERRKAIPLAKNEGVYVRDNQTGNVRAVMGPQAYMLTAHETLWQKKLSANVELLLQKGGGTGSEDIRKIAYFEQCIDPVLVQKGRDPTRVVTYRCPGNTACQVYNYQDREARVIFGPDMVILGPHENFNVLSLSAGKPKKANALQSLCLMLGPDFITDIIQVETSDHARLQIQLAFNNHFKIDYSNDDSIKKIFAIPDFIGYASKHVGSRIRASVAQITFDEFHRHSTRVIQNAVFCTDAEGNLHKTLTFPANNLVLSGVDVQSIEPVDIKMRDSLMKSVQMAIEISTKSIEAAATHEASRLEQKARGELERQKLSDEREAETERAKLLELQAMAAAVESTGQAVAEARAQAERMAIECQSAIEGARLKATASEIEHTANLTMKNELRKAELKYQQEVTGLEVHKEREMAAIEVLKFRSMVQILGRSTISAIATAGPKHQVALLKNLGIETTLITDGASPINLFNTAAGLVAQ